ncbi:MAG: glycosyltransferase, WbnK-like family [Deltaproteobacteria bacterium]|nr:glycosyltransferase, WbnK-like family [Deltaproteobacteria bacterium]
MRRPITVMYLIDTHVPPLVKPSVGGAEKQLYLLATKLDPERFRTVVVQLISSEASEVTVGRFGTAELLHFPTRRFYSPYGVRQVNRIARLARERSVDIIHTFFEKAEVMGWIAKRLSGVPFWVTSRRDLGFKRKKSYDRIFKFASKDCTLCIANCQAIKDRVIEQEGLIPKKVAVIHNGLDVAQFRSSLNGGAFRKEIGADDNAPLIGMVANLNFQIKGHQYFIEAAEMVLEEIPGARFVLVGDGQLRRNYEEMARSLGLQRSVNFLGKRSDVAEILTQLDVSVLCSTSEGFSNVILESMAAGKPVVTTNVGGNSELVDNGVTGYVVPPADPSSLADALLKLLRAPDRARAMGSAARAKAENGFTVEAMVERHDQLYQSLLSKKGVS